LYRDELAAAKFRRIVAARDAVSEFCRDIGWGLSINDAQARCAELRQAIDDAMAASAVRDDDAEEEKSA
jgi:hypothetical protein